MEIDRDIDMDKGDETEPEPEAEPEPEPEPEPVPTKVAEPPPPKKKGSRKSIKGRASDIRGASGPKSSRRSSIKKESPTPRNASKRQVNGQPKPKTWSTEMEKKIQNSELQIENDASKLDPLEFDEAKYVESARKRRRLMQDQDSEQNYLRRRLRESR